MRIIEWGNRKNALHKACAIMVKYADVLKSIKATGMNTFFERLLGTKPRNPNRFFRPIDWTGFWGATIIAFAVYFFTLGPSVGLEDSGELATAGDHLGVPHPPGYPFWTMCSWIFCRLFSWVTYQGQPTPAWAISCLSAVFGAFAAGCTAMLIARSSSDMLDGLEGNRRNEAKNAIIGLSAGLGGSLVFAFSPVEWSQSTIVEIYSLNALFLMAVFLLSYRWMRKPSDKILWLTAFIFGLGLTNYQVLLMAAVPLAIIIFLKNIELFRDFMLLLIPVVLTALVLGAGSMFRAEAGMTSEAINKFPPLAASTSCPSPTLLWIGMILLVACPLAAVVLKRKLGAQKARKISLYTGIASIASFALAISPLATSYVKWELPHEVIVAPLADPRLYGLFGLLLAISIVAAAYHALSFGDEDASSKTTLKEAFRASLTKPMAVSAIAGLAAVALALFQTAADSAGYTGEVFSFFAMNTVTILGVAVVAFFSLSSKRGAAFAVPVAAVQLTALILLEKGLMNGLTNPNSWWFIWPIAWNFAMMALAYISLPMGRSIVPALFFAELGVSFYVYMPIVSDLRNPPMNWGYPRTWEGFKHALMRRQYEAIKMPSIFTQAGFEKFSAQLGMYFTDLRLQFTLVAASLALLPFSLWKLMVKPKGKEEASPNSSVTVNMAWIAAAIYVIVALLVSVYSEILEKYTGGDVPWNLDKRLLAALSVIALAGGILLAGRQLALRLKPAARGLKDAGIWLKDRGACDLAASVWKAMCAMTPAMLRLVLRSMARGCRTAAGKVKQLWAKSPMSRVGVSLKFYADETFQQWLIACGVCFAIMSIGLVALADVKGDIQDGFIQKVKFISSHGIFSLWIGYGLVVGIAIADRIFSAIFRHSPRMKRFMLALACLTAAGTALIPIYENYTNDDLVFAMGSAEQNGHTFGWQFGNYQLRGANAIREELSEDEEPLPNPLYPPEMDQGAVFFGGTDPGRFVPTYMIYSANVRPDIYLITQNALADDTYMSVERDLYGDEIWIPSKDDSAIAFNRYFREVKMGKRQENGEVKAENGRMQVTGALAVMGINSILSEMMFNKERLRRSFYIEESYQIDWMYPYLEPHGLIMKIRANPAAVTRHTVYNDLDFWDWYTRRLLRDPALRRDFAAQKSFSKLRTAIAGLYSRQGFSNAAARAFREAILIYPLSPEASFRYIQEYLFPARKMAETMDILDYTDSKDPNNRRTAPFRSIIADIQERDAEIKRLTAKLAQGALSPQESIDLALLYASAGRYTLATSVLKELLAVPGADKSWTVQFKAARVFSLCQRTKEAEAAMDTAVALAPKEVLNSSSFAIPACEVFIDAGAHAKAEPMADSLAAKHPKNVRVQILKCKVKLELGKYDSAWRAVSAALRANQEAALKEISSDPKLEAFIQYMMDSRFRYGDGPRRRM